MSFLRESRGSAVQFRRNSHYGKSPIAYPSNYERKISWALKKNVKTDRFYFCVPEKARFFIIKGRFIMKKISILILALLSLFYIFSFGCIGEKKFVIKESDTYIVILVPENQTGIADDTTLIQYMYKLKDMGQLEFAVKDGMITSINGIDNAGDWSKCWMLYTSDCENSNSAWGSLEYKGNTYGSAIFGAESLKIKKGFLYIWYYQSF